MKNVLSASGDHSVTYQQKKLGEINMADNPWHRGGDGSMPPRPPSRRLFFGSQSFSGLSSPETSLTHIPRSESPVREIPRSEFLEIPHGPQVSQVPQGFYPAPPSSFIEIQQRPLGARDVSFPTDSFRRQGQMAEELTWALDADLHSVITRAEPINYVKGMFEQLAQSLRIGDNNTFVQTWNFMIDIRDQNRLVSGGIASIMQLSPQPGPQEAINSVISGLETLKYQNLDGPVNGQWTKSNGLYHQCRNCIEDGMRQTFDGDYIAITNRIRAMRINFEAHKNQHPETFAEFHAGVNDLTILANTALAYALNRTYTDSQYPGMVINGRVLPQYAATVNGDEVLQRYNVAVNEAREAYRQSPTAENVRDHRTAVLRFEAVKQEVANEQQRRLEDEQRNRFDALPGGSEIPEPPREDLMFPIDMPEAPPGSWDTW